MIVWALIYDAIQYASTMVMFKLFIYEQIGMSASIMAYVVQKNYNKAPIGNIQDMCAIHCTVPGQQTIDDFGIFAPWVIDTFTHYFQATDQSMRAMV